MQISSINSYDSLFTKVSQLYGNTSKKTNQVSFSNISSNSTNTDQVDLSEDYMSFLDKVKNGTVSNDDLTKMADEMNSTQMQMPPPPPTQMTGTGSGENTDAIDSFLDKVKNGTVTSDDLTSMESVLANVGSRSDDGESVSTTEGSNQISFKSFMDKVKDGTVTDDDLAQMKSLIQKMDQNGTQGAQNRPPMGPPPMGMGFGESDDSNDDSTSSTSSTSASTVSSAGSSDSTNSLTLQSFLDKVKNGTVSDDDLTQMQSVLKEMGSNVQGTHHHRHMHASGVGMGTANSSDSTSNSSISTVSDSDGTDSLSLQSFLDKVKNGTVTKDDLTQMQSIMDNWLSSGSDSFSTNEQASL